MPPRPDQAPTARARWFSANDAWRMARLPGVSSAPPMPWNARAPFRAVIVGATAHSIDPTANQARPMQKIRRRPYRSASDPERRISEASVSV